MTQELIVNCIHIFDREDRYKSILKQQKEQGFYLKFWEAIEIRTDRKQGICKSHKAIIRDAKENGYPMVCVIEDDAIFFKEGAWDFFLSRIPENGFDIFFSMIYVGDISEDNRIQGLFSAMTMYVVHERFYDFFLSLPDSCHIDRELGLTSHIHEYYVCSPFVCEQDGSQSSNSFMKCDYRPYLEGRKIYGKD